MYDIFISYKRSSGSEFSSFLVEILQEEGYSVFCDNKLREGTYRIDIEQAIAECRFFLLLLAVDDLKESLLRYEQKPDEFGIIHEILLADQYGKIIIPICISDFNKKSPFPDHCNVEAVSKLKGLNICDLHGRDAAFLSKTRLFEFMKHDPVSKIRAEYYQGILTEEFLKWELETLKGIYSDCGEFVTIFGREYPQLIFEGSKDVRFPFEMLSNKGNLLQKCEPIQYEDSPYYEEFKRIVGCNIHFPNLYGFANEGLLFDDDGKVNGFIARPRMYKETVFTCHILHFELWKVYQKLKKEGLRLATIEDLLLRKKIHDGKAIQEVILTGCNRSSLCDVNIAMLSYDPEEERYGIAIAERSQNVATYPGYLSFVPTGGFELFELEKMQTDENIQKNFSVIASLYREYLEEIFNCGTSAPTGDDDLKRINRFPEIKRLKKGIQSGSFHFEFLGIAYDLITLRPTFSFVLRIDDPDFYDNIQLFTKNDESDKEWSEPLETISEIAGKYPLLPESAATYKLLLQNHLFTEVE